MHHSKPHKYEFIFSIIKALQLNPVEFEHNLRKGAAYESIIYNWVVNLYQEGKSCDEAFRIIFEKRVQVLYSINENIMLEDTIVTNRKYQKVLENLQTIPLYMNLKEKEKQSIRRKAIALIETRLWSVAEIVDFTIEIIKNTINLKPQQKTRINQRIKTQNSFWNSKTY